MLRKTVTPNGVQVRLLRVALGWRQEDVAKHAGVAKKTVENVESGVRVWESNLELIAKALKVDLQSVALSAAPFRVFGERGHAVDALLDLQEQLPATQARIVSEAGFSFVRLTGQLLAGRIKHIELILGTIESVKRRCGTDEWYRSLLDLSAHHVRTGIAQKQLTVHFCLSPPTILGVALGQSAFLISHVVPTVIGQNSANRRGGIECPAGLALAGVPDPTFDIYRGSFEAVWDALKRDAQRANDEAHSEVAASKQALGIQ